MKIIYKDGHVDECPQEEELHVIRHTAAHIMAQAIKRLFPQADFAYGPATQNGFYYDVDLGDTKLTAEDLENIEKEMKKIVKANLPIKSLVLNREDAKKLMEERGEKYKLEHMEDLAEETEFSFYQQGEYVDMCLGPHLTYTKALKAFKVTQQSGAYWKNNSENKMLTRINGVAFRSAEELAEWEKQQAEARERDHRKIGKEMQLYMTDDLIGDDPLHRHRGSLQDLRPLGALQGQHVPGHGDGRRGLCAAPHELPAPHAYFCQPSPLLSPTAHPHRRDRP